MTGVVPFEGDTVQEIFEDIQRRGKLISQNYTVLFIIYSQYYRIRMAIWRSNIVQGSNGSY